jgi:nucleoside-diphosphate-sugar epimerase
MGFCMNQLKHDDKIEYTISGKTQRDFISIKSVCKVLNKVVEIKPQGIYNLSSNHGTEIGDVARSLIEGYGSGKFIESGQVKDQFILKNTKLLKTLNIELPVFQKKYIKKLGEKL